MTGAPQTGFEPNSDAARRSCRANGAAAPAPARPVPSGSDRRRPQIAFESASLETIARHMYALMLRNVASDGFQFRDPTGILSRPGCIIAAPSYPGETPGIDQDYVYHWVRDAAITIVEIAAAEAGADGDTQPLVDYVTFAKLCQGNATPTLAHAVFKLDGTSRPWTEQSDGPAVQTLAILGFFDRLDPATRAVARDLMQVNVDYLVGAEDVGAYNQPTRNLWEEKDGLSFFTRSVQLACLRAVAASDVGLNVPATTGHAIAALEDALGRHWNGTIYLSMLEPPAPGEADKPLGPAGDGYDPNIDIVCAAIYGAVPVTDPKLLATAAKLRWQWEDPTSEAYYPVNETDKALGLGPLLGRYPGDHYDGDVAHPVEGGHPWALCTANLAELYYRVANAIVRDGSVPADPLAQPFLAQVGAQGSAPDAAVGALRAAGDAMLRAILYHSDHLELSEQFDGTSGYERSVRNLTWSYAAFLSAVRARTGGTV